MAAILPFPVRQTGDWSDNERARLDELAARFADQAGVEVAFGRSDSGDPWCVVLDAHDEVLVHIARVEGDVVVHAAAPDVLVRAPDLRTAVERVLGSRWLEERADVVVPFASGNRAMQVVTAVLIVGSFAEHHRAEAEPVDDWIFAPRPLKPLARDGQRDDAAKVALVADAGPDIELAPGLADPVRRPAESLPFGTSFDQPRLAGEPDAAGDPGRELAAWVVAESEATAGDATADVIIGTPGDDRLDGRRAPPGLHDLLDGGAGDDRLILDGGTIAIGGDGADRFLLRAPEVTTAGELALLGIIVDFEAGVDVLTAGGAPSFTIVATVPIRNIFADPNINLGPLPELPGRQIFADLDGDGRADGYVLVNSVEPSPALLDAVRQAVAPVPEPPAPMVEPAVPTPPVEFAAERTAEPTVPTTPIERPAKPIVPEPPVEPAADLAVKPVVPASTAEPVAELAAEPIASAPTVEPAAERAIESIVPAPAPGPSDDPKPEPIAPASPIEPVMRVPTAEPAHEPNMLASIFELPVEPMTQTPTFEVI